MKKIIFAFAISMLLTASLQAQVSLSLRGGSQTTHLQPFFSPELSFTAHNISLCPSIIVFTNRNAPAAFGVRASYQYKCIEAGAARYFELYSTDAYDKYKNGWSNSAFVALHYKNLFIQYEYLKGSQFSIGIKGNIANLVN